jgi:predicted nucleic-acid-binding protein
VIAVDTNVLVRLLIDDSSAPEQMERAKALLKKVRQVFISQIVQIELVWVLESAYGLDKTTVIELLKLLQRSPCYVLQQTTQFDAALMYFENNPADFSDYLILATCGENDCDLYMFDKKFARLASVNLLNI